ncbi:hypothetical protein PAMP_014282 [Pampus punctatissimus]
MDEALRRWAVKKADSGTQGEGLPAPPPQAEPRTSALIHRAPLLLEEEEEVEERVVSGQREATETSQFSRSCGSS